MAKIIFLAAFHLERAWDVFLLPFLASESLVRKYRLSNSLTNSMGRTESYFFLLFSSIAIR